jgi:hypothetical protein
MNSRHFASFAEMIDSLPVKGILKAATVERLMLEDDLAHKRTPPTEEAGVHSIVNFCRFLEAARLNLDIFPVAVPVVHFVFYRKTVANLIEAGELPGRAEAQFEATFSSEFIKNLMHNPTNAA